MKLSGMCFHQIDLAEIIEMKDGTVAFRLPKMDIAPRSTKKFDAEFGAAVAYIEAHSGKDYFAKGVCIEDTPHHVWAVPHGDNCSHAHQEGISI